MKKLHFWLLTIGCAGAILLLYLIMANRSYRPAMTTEKFVESAALPRIEQALETYRKLKGSYPSTEEGLPAVAAFLKKNKIMGFEVLDRPVAPWGSNYQYRCPSGIPGHLYDLWSLGRDRIPSRDDIWAPKISINGN